MRAFGYSIRDTLRDVNSWIIRYWASFPRS